MGLTGKSRGLVIEGSCIGDLLGTEALFSINGTNEMGTEALFSKN